MITNKRLKAASNFLLITTALVLLVSLCLLLRVSLYRNQNLSQVEISNSVESVKAEISQSRRTIAAIKESPIQVQPLLKMDSQVKNKITFQLQDLLLTQSLNERPQIVDYGYSHPLEFAATIN